MSLEYDSNKGYWHSDECFKFDLPFKITDVTKIGKTLVKYLKGQKLPFKYSKIFDIYFNKITDQNMRETYKDGYVLIWLHRPNIKSKLNPFHNEMRGDETITIEFSIGNQSIRSYQEYKSEYMGIKVTWKLELYQINKFKKILENFCKGKGLSKKLLLPQINPSMRNP